MEQFELIEKYIQGQLSESEVQAFEQRLTTEPELKAEVDMVRDMILVVEVDGLKQSLRGRTIGEEAKVVSMKKSEKNGFNIRNWAVAASFLAFVACGWWMMSQNKGDSDQVLFADAFYTDPGLPTKMSETAQYDFYDAMVEYKQGHYQKAIDVWSKIDSGIGQDTLDYYIAIAHLNKGDKQVAFEQLSGLPESSSLSDKAKWYQLQILIENKDYDKAKSLIETISQDVNPTYNQIKEYLDKM